MKRYAREIARYAIRRDRLIQELMTAGAGYDEALRIVEAVQRQRRLHVLRLMTRRFLHVVR